jgi:signal transduction histidine kinase
MAGPYHFTLTLFSLCSVHRTDGAQEVWLMGQILRNLVSNAIKYTRQGWVKLPCLHEPALVRVEVLDTGIAW